MVSVAILSADQRLSFQIHQWMKEVADSVSWEVHADPLEFVTKIATEVAAELIAFSKGETPDAGEDGADGEPAKQSKQPDAVPTEPLIELIDVFIRLVIVDLELLASRSIEPIEWTRKLKQLMAERERSDPQHPTQFLFMAFEGGTFKVENILDPVIDDLIVKPLDRSVFLQKVEIATSDDPAIKPTYLYRQKTNLMIEIGKDANVDELSEFAFAVRNPFALAPGVFASVHASVLGAGDLSRVICRSYKTEPHPTLSGQFLVRFGFFGIRSVQLGNIKKFMRERQPPQKNRAKPPPVATNDPAVPFNRVAVVDMDGDIFSEIQSTLREHYVGVQVTHYLSYARLLATFKKLYTVASPTAAPIAVAVPEPVAAPAEVLATPDDEISLLDEVAGAPPAPPPEAWTSNGSLLFTVTSKDLELIKFETALASGDMVFGKTRLEWVDRPRDLLSGLDKLDTNELREMVDFAVNGGKGRSYLKIKNPDGWVFYVEARSVLHRAGDGDVDAQVQIEFDEIEQWEYEKHAAHLSNEQIKISPDDLKFDAIYIDVNLIRGDVQPWYDGLNEAFMKAGILRPGEAMPKILLLADEKSKATPEKYRTKIVSDFMFKPLDRKTLSYKAREVVELIPRSESDLPAFLKAVLPVKLAKDVLMEEVSEYGLSINHPTPFKRGATMRFFSTLFGGGADGVVAKCSYCEERKVEKTVTYVCHFNFFGTPDEILKRIRTWIRENYIQSKEGQG